MRKFEPVPNSVSNYRPSKYVNGTLYTYGVFEFTAPVTWADAVEFPVDPAAPIFTSVASAADGLWGEFVGFGGFFTGLTRDDVAGLRYLYRPQNYNIEGLVFSNSVSSGGTAWTPVGGSGTNFVNEALRPDLKIKWFSTCSDYCWAYLRNSSNTFVIYEIFVLILF